MNDFLNGIFRIWEKLPDHSKEAFTKSLGVKQRSALQMGSQLLQYYATMAQQQAELEERMRQEEDLNQKQHAGPQSSRKKSKFEEDEDIIDVEWSETENNYQTVNPTNKRK